MLVDCFIFVIWVGCQQDVVGVFGGFGDCIDMFFVFVDYVVVYGEFVVWVDCVFFWNQVMYMFI